MYAKSVVGCVLNAGVGYHIAYLEKTSPEKLELWNKFIVTDSILYWAFVDLPKLAILLLYRRLFPIKKYRLAIHALMGILAMHTTSTLIAAIVGWFPFNANRHPTIHHGVDNKYLSIYGSLPNIITDVLMLLLPMRIIWNLHLATRLKLGLTITFLVGSL